MYVCVCVLYIFIIYIYMFVYVCVYIYYICYIRQVVSILSEALITLQNPSIKFHIEKLPMNQYQYHCRETTKLEAKELQIISFFF